MPDRLPAQTNAPDRLAGALLVAIILLVAVSEWKLGLAVEAATPWLVIAVVALLAPRLRWTRLAFVIFALALTGLEWVRGGDWQAVAARGLAVAAFIAAFFSALATLRNAADSSPAIRECGRFLSQQPPGRRYLALTAGGQLFALLLNYGAIALLGSLAMSNAREEKNPEVRDIRIRRMLLAVQRGFISTLAWSPLSFAVAISTALVPGTSWPNALLPCLVNGLIVAGIGWAMDTIFKPRLTGPRPPRQAPEGSWALVLPLLLLLGVLVVLVGGANALTGVRVVGLVIVIVPVLSLVWIGIQNPVRPLAAVGQRARDYMVRELPAYRGELVLLMMAGYIGTVGAHYLLPLVEATGVDLAAVPAWVILVALVWVIPLAGQLAMNPILAVSLMVPLLPTAAEMGVSPAALVVAITAGWTLSGACSPYTATTLLIGSFGGVSAAHVGLRWNGAYTLICGAVLSVWVAAFSVV